MENEGVAPETHCTYTPVAKAKSCSIASPSDYVVALPENECIDVEGQCWKWYKCVFKISR